MTLRPRFTFEGTPLRRAIDEFGPRIDRQIHAAMEYQSGKVATYAKTNAKWRDRTGNARNGLSTVVEWEPLRRHAIVLFHRVAYGIWLEVRFAGKYAIILPTIQHMGADTMRLLSKLFAKLRTQGGIP